MLDSGVPSSCASKPRSRIWRRAPDQPVEASYPARVPASRGTSARAADPGGGPPAAVISSAPGSRMSAHAGRATTAQRGAARRDLRSCARCAHRRGDCQSLVVPTTSVAGWPGSVRRTGCAVPTTPRRRSGPVRRRRCPSNSRPLVSIPASTGTRDSSRGPSQDRRPGPPSRRDTTATVPSSRDGQPGGRVTDRGGERRGRRPRTRGVDPVRGQRREGRRSG